MGSNGILLQLFAQNFEHISVCYIHLMKSGGVMGFFFYCLPKNLNIFPYVICTCCDLMKSGGSNGVLLHLFAQKIEHISICYLHLLLLSDEVRGVMGSNGS